MKRVGRIVGLSTLAKGLDIERVRIEVSASDESRYKLWLCLDRGILDEAIRLIGEDATLEITDGTLVGIEPFPFPGDGRK